MGFGGSKQGPPTAVGVPPPNPVSPYLNNIFSGLFGGDASKGGEGGAGRIAIDKLKDIASGVDVSKMFDAIKQAGVHGQKEGQAALESKFASTGASISSDMMRAVGDYNTNYQSQLNQTLEDLLLKGKSLEMGAASTLEETFSNAALNFAPSAVVAAGSVNQAGNAGAAALQAGTSIGTTLLMLGAMGFL